MGATQSDLRRINNDFELVVRTSKALEQKLHEMFETPRTASLSENIRRLRSKGVREHVISDLFQLNSWRNRLLHDPCVNSLDDLGVSYSEFRNKFEAGCEEIDRVSSENRVHFIGYGDNYSSALVSSSNRSAVSGRSSAMSGGGGAMAALAIGALTLGALALSGGGSGAWVCDDCGSRHSGSDGDRRHQCKQCFSFDVCSSCFSRSSPPSCGHRSFQVRSDPDEPWRNVIWPSSGGLFW